LYLLFCVPAIYLLFTPSRASELEDLDVSLVGEQEMRESMVGSRAPDKDVQQANVTN
jgi:hypothetical protein